MVARNTRGQTIRLPFVESYQENARCLWVKGPVKESAKLTTVGRKLEKFLGTIAYSGMMGVELFDTGSELVINELAPRVHNSGHYSLDALSDDQFSLHIKAILGQDLGRPRRLSPGFAMLNLLGETAEPAKWLLPSAIKLHWYGKEENRPGRKMGHINALAATPEKALVLVKKHRAFFRL
jgi:5-(carboxyamino)imidazole ribonucleotide synthase